MSSESQPTAPAVTISTETITLGKFLKLAGLAETGGMAKELVADGAVTLNGEPSGSRGELLHEGDVVCVDEQCARVAREESDEGGDVFDEITENLVTTDDFHLGKRGF